MAWRYLRSKGLGVRGHVHKTRTEKFLESAQVKAMLDSCTASRDEFNANWFRDYAAIYMGYSFGLRIGEARLLERRHFSDLASQEVAHIPTLKQWERVPYVCAKCEKRCRVSSDKINAEYKCPRCGQKNLVKPPRGRPVSQDIPERDPPVIEGQVVDFVLDYLERGMRPDQVYLFEGRPGKHLSEGYLSRIFNTHAARAGLSNKYSWHSFRHGRASKLWSMFKNLILVRDSLRQKTTAMAEVYAHMDTDEINRTRKKLERGGIEHEIPASITPIPAKGTPNGRKAEAPRHTDDRHGEARPAQSGDAGVDRRSGSAAWLYRARPAGAPQKQNKRVHRADGRDA